MARLVKVRRALDWASSWLTATLALTRAEAGGLPGTEFARYGRRLAVRSFMRGQASLASLAVTPVNCVRYFEFAFAQDQLPDSLGDCLDISSPALFSLWALENRHPGSLTYINPDSQDLARTAAMAQFAKAKGLRLFPQKVESWLAGGQTYDVIWSLSVLEHIFPEDADSAAIRKMYLALRPGGRLIISVPMDRTFWVEHRAGDPYHLGASVQGAEVPFQRFYSGASLWDRLINAVGVEPAAAGVSRPG